MTETKKPTRPDVPPGCEDDGCEIIYPDGTRSEAPARPDMPPKCPCEGNESDGACSVCGDQHAHTCIECGHEWCGECWGDESHVCPSAYHARGFADGSAPWVAWADHETARADAAEANYRFMVERAADARLDGYRELAARAATAERERDDAVARALTTDAKRDWAHARIVELEAFNASLLKDAAVLRRWVRTAIGTPDHGDDAGVSRDEAIALIRLAEVHPCADMLGWETCSLCGARGREPVHHESTCILRGEP